MENSNSNSSSSALQLSSSLREAQNKAERISGHNFYSPVGQYMRAHGRMSDTTFADVANLSSCTSSHGDLGSSFLALLSGPASLLKFDCQELSSSKPLSKSVEFGSVSFSPTGSQVPLTSIDQPSEIGFYQNMHSQADPCLRISPRVAAASSICGNNTVIQNGLPAAKVSVHGSDMDRTVVHNAGLGNEKLKEFYPLRGEWLSTSPANPFKLQKLPLEEESFASNNSSRLKSGCLRVFCMDISGDLLLSNTGLLGILCSCHCFHMSASKFCEHSGLWNVNPGNAIRMASGETIAQWRKLYFQKIGIRVPGDQSGWDWTEGFPLTNMRSGVSITNMPKSSDGIGLLSSSEGLARSKRPLSNVVPKNFLADPNSVIEALHDKQSRNGQVGNQFHLKGLVGTSQSNSCSVGDAHVTDISSCSIMTNVAGRGPDISCQSMYIDAIIKNRSLATTHTTLQNCKSAARSSDVVGDKEALNGAIMDKDATFSRIELKLGQPFQQSQSPGNPVQSVIGPQLYNRHNSHNLFSHEQLINNACFHGEESRHLLHAAELSNSATRKEQNQLIYGNFAITKSSNADKLEKLNLDTPVSLFKHYTLPEGRLPSDAANNFLNIMPERRDSGSHAVKSYPTDFPWIGGNALNRQHTIPELDFLKPTGNGKEVGCIASSSYFGKAPGSSMQKEMDNPSSYSGAVHGATHITFPYMHDRNRDPYLLSNVPQDVLYAANFSNCLGKSPCFETNELIDHVFCRSKGSSMDSIKSWEVPIVSSSSTSTYIPGLAHANSKQESCFMSPYQMANDFDKFTSVAGLNRCCNYSISTQGMPLQCEEFGMLRQLPHDLIQKEQSLLRLGKCQDNMIHSNERESCCQKTLYFQYNCSCSAPTKCKGGACLSGAGDDFFSDQNKTVSCKTPALIVSQFAKDPIIPKVNALSFDQCGVLKGQLTKNVTYHTSEWKDVPSKLKQVYNLDCGQRSMETLDKTEPEFGQLEDNAAKRSDGAVPMADCFKMEDVSNVSSGCSTHAVTQASFKVTNSNVDSSTVVGITGNINNMVVDEGSGLGTNKCWSSDDAFESDRSTNFYGSTCKTKWANAQLCNFPVDKSSRSLLDEVKLMDSLTWKEGRNQKHYEITAYGKANQSEESNRSLKIGKRKREMQLKVLDEPFGTAVPVLHGKCPESEGTADKPCLSNNAQKVSSDPESSWKSDAPYFRINSKHRNSTLSVTKTQSHKQEIQSLISKYELLDNMNAASAQQATLCYLKAKPVVCGIYGEIVNRDLIGDVPKSVKIVSLDKVLRTASRCSLPKKCKPGPTSLKEIRTDFCWSNAPFDKFSNLRKEKNHGKNDALIHEDVNIHTSPGERNNSFASDDEHSADEFPVLEKSDDKSGRGCMVLDTKSHAQSKLKYKEIHSLYELTLTGKSPNPKMVSGNNIFRQVPKIKLGNILENSHKSQVNGSDKVDLKRCAEEPGQLSITDVDSCCSVCRSSNNDKLNCLLKCGGCGCSVTVHHACYGVSKVPKGYWYCKPCRMSSRNIGLLQSEAEGIVDENVGFYERCVLHMTYPTHEFASDAATFEGSCARTEGYKGRKRDGFWHNTSSQRKGKCVVPQEQFNAWIHINGQKSYTRGILKPPKSEKEYDCRKEYNRYKQRKDWKHLVVYKSGIHALGLYTSRFISQGEMVVEYVGEIVGLRVSDKRENEYQSGRKLQYESACYFFRIDEEHIIDATCKGGIARFVNHSCLPNCVAKITSVRNDKKVFFFAERDIYPGEEITYDYHFNHEDEGKKIFCFCNSKNCRGSLN
ncbi:uncharacterized protein LOC126680492 isoform X2 [Mercurialis annua]|uniref:uncharacterized protein LOC126680492 isoform X2 n=1 Tax=Mercurialis annua TaxID=3986 RepID=UPI002160F1D4|nr:uncharacterized protein LOC126680492 isoform X2 [Mercurialis annua]